MDDVGHVVTMTFADEEAMPDELFRRRDAHGTGRENSWPAVRHPPVVNQCDPVSHPVDDIDEIVAHRYLREPMRIFEPGHKSCSPQSLRGGDDVSGLEEEIEIFCLAVDARMFVDRVGTCYDIGNIGGVDGLQGAPVDLPFIVGNPEIAMGERLPFFRRQTGWTSS